MKLTCEICGKEFEAARSRDWGDHCKICADWLTVLNKGPFPRYDSDDEIFGMVIVYLVKKGKLGEDFIHGLIKGIRKP